MSVDENELIKQVEYIKEAILKLVDILDDMDKRVSALEERVGSSSTGSTGISIVIPPRRCIKTDSV